MFERVLKAERSPRKLRKRGGAHLWQHRMELGSPEPSQSSALMLPNKLQAAAVLPIPLRRVQTISFRYVAVFSIDPELTLTCNGSAIGVSRDRWIVKLTQWAHAVGARPRR